MAETNEVPDVGTEELAECEACHEEKPVENGESVVVYTHRVEGRAVAEDREWICGDCIADAEDAKTERAVAAREWRDYDRWEEEARNGVT